MTEEQIIKAMNTCYSTFGFCSECPYKGFEECNNALGEDALDLINRQLACIEHLTAEKERTQNLLNDLMKDEVTT